MYNTSFFLNPKEVEEFNKGRTCKLCGALLNLDKEAINFNSKYYNTFGLCSEYDHYDISYGWTDLKSIKIEDHFFKLDDDYYKYTLKIAFNSNEIINEFSCCNKETAKVETFLMSGKMFHIPKKFSEKKLLEKLKVIWAFR